MAATDEGCAEEGQQFEGYRSLVHGQKSATRFTTCTLLRIIIGL